MEHLFAAIGAVAILAVMASLIGTLHYLSHNPESDLQRHQRLSKESRKKLMLD